MVITNITLGQLPVQQARAIPALHSPKGPSLKTLFKIVGVALALFPLYGMSVSLQDRSINKERANFQLNPAPYVDRLIQNEYVEAVLGFDRYMEPQSYIKESDDKQIVIRELISRYFTKTEGLCMGESICMLQQMLTKPPSTSRKNLLKGFASCPPVDNSIVGNYMLNIHHIFSCFPDRFPQLQKASYLIEVDCKDIKSRDSDQKWLDHIPSFASYLEKLARGRYIVSFKISSHEKSLTQLQNEFHEFFANQLKRNKNVVCFIYSQSMDEHHVNVIQLSPRLYRYVEPKWKIVKSDNNNILFEYTDLEELSLDFLWLSNGITVPLNDVIEKLIIKASKSLKERSKFHKEPKPKEILSEIISRIKNKKEPLNGINTSLFINYLNKIKPQVKELDQLKTHLSQGLKDNYYFSEKEAKTYQILVFTANDSPKQDL